MFDIIRNTTQKSKVYMNPQQRLNSIGLTLPPPPSPIGAYVPAVKSQDQIIISGQLPITDGKIIFSGTLGLDMTVEDGACAAELCAINALSILNYVNKGLDKLRIIKINGYIRSTNTFSEHPIVLNGASNLFGKIFEDQGKHARAVVGVNSLPMGAAVELEVIASTIQG